MAKKTVLVDGKRYDLDHFKSVSGAGGPLPEPEVEKRISGGVPAPVDEDGNPLETEEDAPADMTGEAPEEVSKHDPAPGPTEMPVPVQESLPPAEPKKNKGGRPKGAAKKGKNPL